MRGPPIPWLLGFTNYLNNSFPCLHNSLICVDLVIPSYLGLKVIQIIVLLTAARLRNSFMCVDLASLANLGLSII